ITLDRSSVLRMISYLVDDRGKLDEAMDLMSRLFRDPYSLAIPDNTVMELLTEHFLFHVKRRQTRWSRRKKINQFLSTYNNIIDKFHIIPTSKSVASMIRMLMVGRRFV